MRTAGWIPRRRGRALVAVTTVAVMVASAATAAPAAADPKPNPGNPHSVDTRPSREVDNRHGAKAPTAKQQQAAERIGAAKVRWNPLGEPESVGPDKALAAGLTGDPVAAARRYLLDNPDL